MKTVSQVIIHLVAHFSLLRWRPPGSQVGGVEIVGQEVSEPVQAPKGAGVQEASP